MVVACNNPGEALPTIPAAQSQSYAFDINTTCEPAESAKQLDIVPYRPPRSRPRRNRAERGLPAAEDLLKLVRAYLTHQHQLWPELVKAGVLAKIDDTTLTAMADDLRRRHTTAILGDDFSVRILSRFRRLGAAYLRYSCDNSNPRSLDDQLKNVLFKARQLELFIPWDFVFADASVSGTDPSRQGYSSLKQTMQQQEALHTIVIDEFTRGGRDTLEWFRLASLARKVRKNVIGATDGFDLNSPMGDMMLHILGMFAKFFITKLRESVRRGTLAAHGRRTSVGRASLGYGLVPVLDAHGRPMTDSQGRSSKEKKIHWPTMRHVNQAVEMLLAGQSPSAIAKEFNRLRVDGSDCWTDTSIRRVLLNPIYIGIDIYNRTTNERDSDTGRRIVVKNPRAMWRVVLSPHLRVWSDDTYRKVRRILYAASCSSKLKGRKLIRCKDVYPKSPVESDLVCQCGAPINRVRGGKNAALGCFHGLQGTHGCTMNTVKAQAIVQEVVLEWVRQHLLTPASMERLVLQANGFLTEEASRPREDVTPLKAELADVISRQDRLLQQLESGQSNPLLCRITQRIEELEKEKLALSGRIRQVQTRNVVPPPPITLTDVQHYLEDLRGLLQQEPTAAALALSKITGRIRVSHERYPNKKRGGRWVLSFTPSLLSLLVQRASDMSQGNRAAQPLAFIQEHAPRALAQPVELVVEKRLALHERLVPLVKQLVNQINSDTGRTFTVPEIAQRIGKSKDVVYLTMRLLRYGSKRASRRGGVSEK